MIRRDGFALPAALLALIVVGALVTGGVNAAMQQDRGSANAMHGNIAFLAAERGLQDVLGAKSRLYFQDTVGVPGEVDVLDPVAVDIDGVAAQYTIRVRRMNSRVFTVESEGEVTGNGRYAGSRRSLAEVVRIAYTTVPKDRAMTTQSSLDIKGQSGISGQDHIPTDWEECSDVGLQKSVVAKDLSEVKVVGAGGLTGPDEQNSALDFDSFVEYGDMHLDDLKLMAEHVYPDGANITNTAPVSSGGICDTEATGNWGDPTNPSGDCHYYWPIIYAEGDLHIASSAAGQGILIVEGDLHISGGYEFSGIVFTYGSFTASGSGNKVVGSVNVFGQTGTSEIDNSGGGGGGSGGVGKTEIVLSSCAIERAHQYNTRFARAIPLTHRGFVDLSGLGVD